MTQSPSNCMEGVPVKISEKYKPPPISFQRLKSDDSNWSPLQYDFSLERSVLSKIEQWKKVREIDKENRRARIRRCELDRAREIEENQKQLLTAVSYPSTEELSSDEETMFSPVAAAATASGHIQNESNAAASMVQFSPSQQRFDTILMPTVVPETYNKSKISSVNISKINYSDFENDTSSPFDNVELKTINDLDILAQVLNVTQIHSKEKTVPSDESSENVKNSNDLCEDTTQDPCINGNGVVQPINPYPSSFLHDTNTMSYDQMGSYNFSNVGGTPNNELYYYNNLPNNQLYNGYSGGNFANNIDGNHSNVHSYHRPLSNQINHGGNHSALDVKSYIEPTIVQSARSKSKSVPDILKELNDEITDSEMRRCKEDNNQTSGNDEVIAASPKKLISREEQQNPEAFVKLSPSLQRLVRNISLMGFPLERVSKIAEKLGSDDKKIFEHLIPLSELLDLGFEESKVSEALLRFDNNKEKALDFLIS